MAEDRILIAWLGWTFHKCLLVILEPEYGDFLVTSMQNAALISIEIPYAETISTELQYFLILA